MTLTSILQELNQAAQAWPNVFNQGFSVPLPAAYDRTSDPELDTLAEAAVSQETNISVCIDRASDFKVDGSTPFAEMLAQRVIRHDLGEYFRSGCGYAELIKKRGAKNMTVENINFAIKGIVGTQICTQAMESLTRGDISSSTLKIPIGFLPTYFKSDEHLQSINAPENLTLFPEQAFVIGQLAKNCEDRQIEYWITVEEQKHYVLVKFQDKGPGFYHPQQETPLQPAELHHVFQELSDTAAGGLGLQLVYHLMKTVGTFTLKTKTAKSDTIVLQQHGSLPEHSVVETDPDRKRVGSTYALWFDRAVTRNGLHP